MGAFIAIEGGDGSGKGTQTKLLAEYLEKERSKNVLVVSFPRHGEASAYYADQYLNGSYGGINDVHADLASLPYAFDRFGASQEIREHLKKPNGVVICDRYVGSNLAHQGTKFTHKKDRLAYYDRMIHTEYEILGIPRPDINILLLVPSAIAQANVDKKEKRAYTDRKRDIHEEDSSHLDKAKANYEELTTLYPDWFVRVECMEKGAMRSIASIQKELRKSITDLC